jgi:hypothetical protein
MERNTAYNHIFSELTQQQGPHENSSNWAALKVFESGDAADRETWEMALGSLQRSPLAQHRWVSEREGVLVRVDDDGLPQSPGGLATHHLLSQGEPAGLSLLSVYHPCHSLRALWVHSRPWTARTHG